VAPPGPEFVSVVIPAFNETGRLPASLRRIDAYCRGRFSRHEILVVDDGSTDGTAELVRLQPGVGLLRMPRNSGKGAAVRAGMLAAAGDIVLFTDADLSTPIEELEGALRCLADSAQVVIASRDLPDSRIERHQNAVRESMGKAFNLVVRTLAHLPYRDTQCGFKCYRAAAAREIYRRTRIDGFAFDVETLVIARRLGYVVVEMPVRWVDCPKSKVNIFRHPLEMIGELLRIRWNDLRRLYG
jgi:dolichyl-phosphate beta-glucosyltransferase